VTGNPKAISSNSWFELDPCYELDAGKIPQVFALSSDLLPSWATPNAPFSALY
jgi:hypothetical protein